MKKSGIIIATMIAGAEVSAQTKWNIDPSHSMVRFSVTHLMVSETNGQFKLFDGKITTSKEDFTDANIEFSIDVNSINTDDEKRDGHLKSADFFDVNNYPKMIFKSKSFKKTEGKNYKLSGDLTIKNVTKSMEFDVVYNGTANDPWGNTKAGFKLNGNINRMDFGLKWNVAIESGGVLVSETVKISCDVELGKEKMK